MKKTLIYISILAIVLTTITLWSTKDNRLASPADEAGMSTGDPAIGGAFTLTDQNGKEVKDLDFRGRVMLVFFGFTHCPDICPVTSKALSDTMGLLGEKADQVAPIFITVDPERDTPAVMKDYFASFDSRIVALTGTPEQVKQAAGAYKAYYAKTTPEDEQVQEEQMDANGGDDEASGEQEAVDDHHNHHQSEYLMDHSGYIYLMDRDGKYVQHFQFDATPEALAEALKPFLK